MIPITDQAQAAYPDAPGDKQKTAATERAAAESGFQPFGEDGFTFEDFIDIINPLQHIPIVSTFYRQWTGDDLDPGSRIGGGTLFGGPIGLVASLINVVVDETTGKDVGEQVVALFSDGAPRQTAELTDPAPAVASVWINPDAAAPAPFATAYGPDERGGEMKEASPVQEEIDVLVWAQRETAIRRRAQAAEAAIGATKIARSVAAMQTSKTQIAALGISLGGSLGGSLGSREAVVARAETPSRQSIGTGATAPLGGWFSDTMLSALTKYQAASGLKGGGGPPAAK